MAIGRRCTTLDAAMATRARSLLLVLVAACVAAAVWARVRVRDEARATAARLLGCTSEIEVEPSGWGLRLSESWRVRGCGVEADLTCDPANAGCALIERPKPP